MEEAVKNSCLSQAKLIIHETKAEAFCSACKQHFSIDDFFAVCPRCANNQIEITKGKELKVSKLKVV